MSQIADPSSIRPRPRRKYARWVAGLVLALLLGLIGLELVARLAYGLGDPPLLMTDSDTEYRYRPSSRYRRMGNDVAYNAFSMRSPDFPAEKADPAERRVMVLGDSVVNGGQWTDQADLATTLLEPMLESRLGRPVTVGNLLGYARKFGLFDADVVVIVLNSEDAADVPGDGSNVGSADFPDRRPWLALGEVAGKAWSKYRPSPAAAPPEAQVPPAPAADAAPTAEALAALIQRARADGAEVLVVLYPMQSELAGGLDPDHSALKAAALSAGVPPENVIDPAPAFRSAVAATAGDAPIYRDDIHPDVAGQRVLAEVLLDPVVAALDRTSDRQGLIGSGM